MLKVSNRFTEIRSLQNLFFNKIIIIILLFCTGFIISCCEKSIAQKILRTMENYLKDG